MNDPKDPIGGLLRSYYQSIQRDAPVSLSAAVERSLRDAPADGAGLTPRRLFGPVLGFAAVAAVAFAIVALALGGFTPGPGPTQAGGPTAPASASPTTSAARTIVPSSGCSIVPSAGQGCGPTAGETSAETTEPSPPSPTPSPTSPPSPTPTYPVTSGTLIRLGDMNPALTGPAVFLNNATILVAGGRVTGGNGVQARTDKAEIYVEGGPNRHTFQPTGSMTQPRYLHTLTLLVDGRVLVVGGADMSDGSGNLAGAEIYDPNTGKFTATGSMSVGRAEHTATLIAGIAGDKVLITGGYGGGTLPLAGAELYDVTGGTFSPTGSMTTPRQRQTATLLDNGLVLITGGLDDYSHVLASAELYDPMTGKFRATGSMTTPREWHTATLLGDGRVLVTGGIGADQSTPLAGAEIYDPTTGKFTPTGSMKAARSQHTAAWVVGSLIQGVAVVGGDPGNSLEVFDTTTGTFRYFQNLLGPISAAANMGGDRLVLTGQPAQMYCSWPAAFSPCQ
jgi:Galactose oxidase, central domain